MNAAARSAASTPTSRAPTTTAAATTPSIPRSSGGRTPPSPGSSSGPTSCTSRTAQSVSQQEQLYAETVTWYRRYGVSDRAVPATVDDFWARFDWICAHELELTPAVSWVLDPETNPGPAERPHLPGPLSVLDGLAAHFGSEVLRLLVYGALPDRRASAVRLPVVERRSAQVRDGVCRHPGGHPGLPSRCAVRCLARGNPHLHPTEPRRVIVAGPSSRRTARG